MAFFLIFVGTIFFMGILCGCLALMMNFEEVPPEKNKKEQPLRSDLSEFPVAVREEVPESSEALDPETRPQPVAVPTLTVVQEEESVNSN